MNFNGGKVGGYVGSDMYRVGLEQARLTVRRLFNDRILPIHRNLCNSVNADGYANGFAWYKREVDLLSEAMVYGLNPWAASALGRGGGYNIGAEWRQLALFALGQPLQEEGVSLNNFKFWLRDVTLASFSVANGNGIVDCVGASEYQGVLPVFTIY